MSRGSMFVAACIVLGLSVALMPQTSQARPQYNKQAAGLYASNAKLVEAKCGACHGQDKKVRNAYGMALEKALEKNEKDTAKIDAGLKKIESEKAKATDTETFGDRIKAGKLPVE